jgi:hypothetical protein
VHAPAPLELRAQLSRSTRWRVALRNADDEVVADAAGESRRAELVWERDGPVARRPGRLRVGLPLLGLLQNSG